MIPGRGGCLSGGSLQMRLVLIESIAPFLIFWLFSVIGFSAILRGRIYCRLDRLSEIHARPETLSGVREAGP